MAEWFRSLVQGLARCLRLPGGAVQRPDIDPELRDAFCAELDDLHQSLTRGLQAWQARYDNPVALKELRRGFHTIKGSAGLVGADELGDLYRQLEQLAVQLSERPRPATPALLEVLEQAVQLLPELSDCLQHDRPLPPQTRALRRSAQRLLR